MTGDLEGAVRRASDTRLRGTARKLLDAAEAADLSVGPDEMMSGPIRRFAEALLGIDRAAVSAAAGGLDPLLREAFRAELDGEGDLPMTGEADA